MSGAHYCGTCKALLPEEDFYPGRFTRCRACERERQREYRLRPDVMERTSRYMRAYRKMSGYAPGTFTAEDAPEGALEQVRAEYCGRCAKRGCGMRFAVRARSGGGWRCCGYSWAGATGGVIEEVTRP